MALKANSLIKDEEWKDLEKRIKIFHENVEEFIREVEERFR